VNTDSCVHKLAVFPKKVVRNVVTAPLIERVLRDALRKYVPITSRDGAPLDKVCTAPSASMDAAWVVYLRATIGASATLSLRNRTLHGVILQAAPREAALVLVGAIYVVCGYYPAVGQ
jgi:hypothetical protein